MSSVAEGDCSAETKPKLPSEVWVLITANVVVALGYGVVSPVLPQYARHFGVSISAATFVITAFSLLRFVFAPASGLFVQKVGERRVYVSGLLIVALSTGACAFAQTYWELLLFRSLGGLKVTTENAWFAARPSGTEDVYKIYAESFKGPEHLAEVQEAAKEVVNKVIA